MSPLNRLVTIAGANAAAVNFTATANASIPVRDVNVALGRSNSATTVVSPSFSTTATNELLLALVAADNVNAAATTVTNVTGGGLTWVLVRRTNTQKGTAEIWRAFAPAIVTNATVTATLSQKRRGVRHGNVVQGRRHVRHERVGRNWRDGQRRRRVRRADRDADDYTRELDRGRYRRRLGRRDSANSRAESDRGTAIPGNESATRSGCSRSTNPVALSGTAVTINDTAPTGTRVQPDDLRDPRWQLSPKSHVPSPETRDVEHGTRDV